MKMFWLIGVAALQVLTLGYMAGEREWVLRTGRTVYLRTAPVDPRDPLRGDYVHLNYEISRVPRPFWRGSLTVTNKSVESIRADTPVYALLRSGEDSTGDLVSLSTERPAEGLFLRGRTDRSWGSRLQVRYGLEAYFVEQGRGLALERGRDREGIQVPMEMKAAVSPGGLAVLQDHRWCALGIGLNLVTTNAPARNGRPLRQRSLAADVRLLNASSNDLAIVDRPGGRSLALVPDSRWQESPWTWPQEDKPLPAPEPGHVVVLKPGQIHTMRVSFDDSYWAVLGDQARRATNRAPVNLADLTQDWSAGFRFEYRAPERAACAHLPNAALIWHGRLPTRAFQPAGNVD